MVTVVVSDNNRVLNGFEHTDSPNGLSDTGDSTSKDDQGYNVDLDSAGLSSGPVTDNTGDFGYKSITTTPISLASFNAVKDSGQINFNWTTQIEVSNLGFNVYAQIDGAWQRLNDSLIKAKGDSVVKQSYSARYSVNATYFAISDIDIFGTETLHGPFKLGEFHGIKSQNKPTNWSLIKEGGAIELEIERQARKMEQLRRNSRRRQQL